MDESRRVVVTGMSVMAANGQNKEEFFSNLAQGKGGIKKIKLFPTEKMSTDYFGELQNDYLYEIETLEDKSRLECIFEDLKKQLLEDACMSKENLEMIGDQLGFSFATSVGANDYITAHAQGKIKNSISKSNLYKLAKELGVKGPVFVNTTACAAGTTAMGIGFSLIKSGRSNVVIAGGIDPLTEFSSYGFHSLQNLSDTPCMSFDANRKGISIGEGGALFVLETLESAKNRGAKIYGEILGYGLGNDAYHATSPDPSGKGAYRVMKIAIKQAGIQEEDVEYVNAHGTGTVINDSMEAKAITQMKKGCYVSSTKSQTGHCLAAAGAIEMAATLLSIEREVLFPGINLETILEEGDHCIFVREKAMHYPVTYALSNSFAFAGNASSIAVGRYHG